MVITNLLLMTECTHYELFIRNKDESVPKDWENVYEREIICVNFKRRWSNYEHFDNDLLTYSPTRATELGH